jgi:hypothetical protein
MNITQQKSEVRLFKKSDPEFFITESTTIYARASLSISKSIPAEYLRILELCLAKEWIIPVATVRDSELAVGKMWNNLKNTGE